MTRAEFAEYDHRDDAANENERETFETVAAHEHASFQPRIPRKEFGLRRIPPSVLKSWPGICH